jgi:alpha-L-fucosidase
MRLGIYVSPWDRNHAGYGGEEYVETFHEQIREVLGNYGPIFEIWFDGANGGDGYYGGAREKRDIPPGYYRFPEAVAMIRKLQPDCVVWGAGDARWGGSEQGHVAYPHWHTMDSQQAADGATGFPHGNKWEPAEGDVSIRPGWFWHENEDAMVKSPEKLLQIWFDSVGRGANLILNVPPDRDGKIREPDVAALLGFRALRDALLAKDFAAGAKADGAARGDDKEFSAAMLTDGDIESYWSPPGDDTSPAAGLRLGASAEFDVIRLREQIRLGQRVDAFAIDAWIDGAWKEIHSGKTIGNQRLVRLASPVTTDQLRLRITKSAAPPCISEFALFRMPAIAAKPAERRNSKE